MKKKIFVIFISFISIIIVFLVIGKIEMMFRCEKEGWSREKALEVADWKLGVDFKNNPLLPEFVLVEERFEDFSEDKTWGFTYRARECTVIIIIDNCGVADVGGITLGCR